MHESLQALGHLYQILKLFLFSNDWLRYFGAFAPTKYISENGAGTYMQKHVAHFQPAYIAEFNCINWLKKTSLYYAQISAKNSAFS